MQTLKQFFSMMLWTSKIVFRMSPLFISLRFIITSILGVRSIIRAFIIAKVIDEIINILNTDEPNKLESILPLVGLVVAVGLILSVLSWADTHMERYFSTKMRYYTYIILYRKLFALGIEALEDPEITDYVQRYKDNSRMIEAHFWNISSFLSAFVLIAASIIALANNFLWLIIASMILIIPKFFIHKKFINNIWSLDKSYTVSSRRSWNIMWKLIDPESLKEIRLTNAFKFMSNIFESNMNNYLGEVLSIRRNWFLAAVLTRFFDFALIAGGFVLILNLAIEQQITIGAVTFYFSLLESFNGSTNQLIFAITNINESQVRVSEIKGLLEMEPIHADGNNEMEELDQAPSIEFKNVSFKYPRSNRYIYKNLNLKINPGEKIAIVGVNGAGKTTLVKLITRLYQVDSGEILVNGINLNELSIDSWYKNIGVLFQDYNTYPDLTAYENIVIGRSESMKDDFAPHNLDEKVIRAAKNADAYSFIKKYENEFLQVLSEKYSGGIRPSTGQWQKIAIARFFYRDAQLLILDEPTASIDAESEYNIFNQIYEFIENRTVIIVSHRFSTVRNADRIIVVDKGNIVEQGSHDELLKLKGKYANAFKIQAKGYSKKEE